MDWLTWDPDYLWAIALVTSVLLNIFQFAQVHGLHVFKKAAEKNGHVPDGMVLVPEHVVAVNAPATAATPAEILASMKPGNVLPEGWAVRSPVPPPAAPQPPTGVLADLADAGHAGAPPPSTGTPEEEAALHAARSYRVAWAMWGVSDPRTDALARKLATYPHWSDVLKIAGGPGFSGAVEADLANQLRAQQKA